MAVSKEEIVVDAKAIFREDSHVFRSALNHAGNAWERLFPATDNKQAIPLARRCAYAECGNLFRPQKEDTKQPQKFCSAGCRLADWKRKNPRSERPQDSTEESTELVEIRRTA